jgi:hypothetical protein
VARFYPTKQRITFQQAMVMKEPFSPTRKQAMAKTLYGWRIAILVALAAIMRVMFNL